MTDKDQKQNEWVEFAVEESAADPPPDAPADSQWVDTAEKEHNEYWDEYKRRDVLYSDMLQHYLEAHKSKAKSNKRFKFFFFWITMLILMALVGAPIAAMIIFALKSQIGYKEIALVISGIPGIISAIIVLPKIIAEHLFPTNEDSNMIDLVKKMQDNDAEIRHVFTSYDPKQDKK